MSPLEIRTKDYQMKENETMLERGGTKMRVSMET